MARKAKAVVSTEPEFYDGEVAPTVVSEEPNTPKHSARILQLADDFGIGRDEAEAMTEERLADLVYALTRRAAKIERERKAEESTVLSTPSEPAPLPAPAAEPDEYAHLAGKFDDEIVNELRKLSKRNKELESGHQKFVQESQAREANAYRQILDDAFMDLGEQYTRLVGAGGMGDLEQNSPEAQRRRAIFSAAGIDFSQRPGARAVTQKIKAAAQMLLGHHIPEPPKRPEPKGLYGEPAGETRPRPPMPRDPATGRIIPKAVVEQIEEDFDWATNLERPTHRHMGEIPDGPEKATRNLAARQSELKAIEHNGASGHAQKGDFL